MSYLSVAVLENMAVDYNATRIYTGRLKFFVDNASHLNQIVNNLNGSGNLDTQYSAYFYSSDPQYDEWAYFVGSAMEASDFCHFSYLYENYFKNGVVGDRIWFYNANNPAFAFGFRYKGATTTAYGVYYRFETVLYIRNSTIYAGNDLIGYGIDSSGQKRDCILSAVIDASNGYAYPLFNLSVANQDPDNKSGNNGRPFGWYPSIRTVFNEYRYYYYIMLMNVYTPPEPTDDPYTSNNYGPGENQGGDGDGDDTSDTIAVPSNPTLEVTSSGMVTIFTPDITQIQTLASALIDPNFFQALGNVFASLDEVILGLHIVPLVVPYSGPSTAISINLLGIAYRVSVGLYKATVQFIDVDCGTLDVNEYWGNCLDYNPYTKITIFLPFIGYVDIDADDVMNKTVGIKYRVDVATGACIAFITANGSVMYQYAGNCALPIPVSSTDQNSAIQNIVSIATAAVSGGAGLAAAGAAVADAESAFDKASGYKEIKAAISGLDKAKAHYEAVTEKNIGKLTGVSANAVVNSKAQFHHGGSLGTSAGFMGIKKPYMIIRRPKQMVPDKYGAFNGYPTNTYVQLNDLIGYTRVSDIRLNIPDATVDEILECERLLKEGVVL